MLLLIWATKTVLLASSFIKFRSLLLKKDWNATYPDMNIMAADKEEVADQEEEYENRASFELELESRLRDINDALVRVETGKFGKCTVGGENIDEARLRANPAAATCIKHAG